MQKTNYSNLTLKGKESVLFVLREYIFAKIIILIINHYSFSYTLYLEVRGNARMKSISGVRV